MQVAFMQVMGARELQDTNRHLEWIASPGNEIIP